jgi:hypothetical protein
MKNKWKQMMVISLALCFGSMIFAALLQSTGGKVEVQTLRIGVGDGKVIEVLLFKPRTATAEKPAPLVITMHGSYNNKEMQDANTIELARRGVVVINMDALGHGNSSLIKDPFTDYWRAMQPYANKDYIDPNTAPTDGMSQVLDWAYHGLNYIDKGKIGIMGHSMGAAMAHSTLMHDIAQNYAGKGPRKVFAVLDVGSNIPMADYVQASGNFSKDFMYNYNGKPADLTTAFMKTDLSASGDVRLPYNVNFGICAAAYDEFAFKFADQPLAINFPQSESARIFVNHLDNQRLAAGQAVELEKFYYGPINGSGNYARVLYQPKEIHPYNHFSKAATAVTIDFFSNVFGGLPREIVKTNQIWKIKEYINCLGLIGFFVFVAAFAAMMLELPFFVSLKAAGPVASAPAPKDIKGKAVYWIGIAIGAALPPLLLYRIQGWVASFGYFSGIPLYGNKIWPFPSPFEIGVWAGSVSILTLVIFFVSRALIVGKGVKLFDLPGLRISGVNLWKTILLTAATVTAAYSIVFFARYFFAADFRIWTFAVKAFSPARLLVALRYIILFAVFYVGNAIAQNCGSCVEGRKEWLNILICSAANIIGICALQIIQYVTLFSKGTMPFNAMRTLNVWTLIPILVIATIIARSMYKRTGTIYLGALINTALFSIIPVANTLAMTF